MSERQAGEGSRIMNEALLTGRYRGRRTGGLIDRLDGADMTGERRERFNAAHQRFEAAVKHKDDAAREAAEVELDAVVAEARAAREGAAVSEPPASGFDGGVRGQRMHRPAYMDDPRWRGDGPAAFFRMALQASADQPRRRESLL
jgi:hypothetical protein